MVLGAIAAFALFLLARYLGASVRAAWFALFTFVLSIGLLEDGVQFVPPISLAGLRSDPVSLGVLLVLIALGLLFRRTSQEGTQEFKLASWLPGALGIGVSIFGAALLVERRTGIDFGALVAEGLLGSSEARSDWAFLPVFLFCGVSLLVPTGRLGHRSSLQALLLLLTGILIAFPGLERLWLEWIFVAALLAGDGFESARVSARVALVSAVVLLLIPVGVAALRPPEQRGPEQDELVHFTSAPPRDAVVEGWVHPSVPLVDARLQLHAVRPTAGLGPRSVEVELRDAPRQPMPDHDAPAGARWFFAQPFADAPFSDAPRGRSRIELHLLGIDAQDSPVVLGRRHAGEFGASTRVMTGAGLPFSLLLLVFVLRPSFGERERRWALNLMLVFALYVPLATFLLLG